MTGDIFRSVCQDEHPSLFPSSSCHIYQSSWVLSGDLGQMTMILIRNPQEAPCLIARLENVTDVTMETGSGLQHIITI